MRPHEPVEVNKEDFFLFLSVDVIDSTQRKYQDRDWTVSLSDFYSEFSQILKEECSRAAIRVNAGKKRELTLPVPSQWKINGDELLFFISIIESFREVKPAEDSQYSLILWYINVFRKAIARFNETSELKIKGTAWTGNTPVDNSRVESERTEFIGKSIDIGFRISKFAEIGKFVISVELAILLMRDNFLTLRRNDIRLFCQNKVVLKGVLGNKEYPVIWIDLHNKLNELEMELAGTTPQSEVTLLEYLEEYINSTMGQLHYPFISNKDESKPFNTSWPEYTKELDRVTKIRSRRTQPQGST